MDRSAGLLFPARSTFFALTVAAATVGSVHATGCALGQDDNAVEDQQPGESAVTGDASTGSLKVWKLRAVRESFLKTKAASAGSLSPDEQCTIPADTELSLRQVTSVGLHVSGTLDADVEACAGKEAFTKGAKVFVFDDHFVDAGPHSVKPDSSVFSAANTCDPRRANGTVSRAERALLDVLAYAEGTRGKGKDGYNIGFSFKVFSSCARHPDNVWSSPGYSSSAAGRYQFMPPTWKRLQDLAPTYTRYKTTLSSFEPENQEVGGLMLVTDVRKIKLLRNAPMTRTQFSNALLELSYEWASLPPSRYGQPTKASEGALWNVYCANVGGCF